MDLLKLIQENLEKSKKNQEKIKTDIKNLTNKKPDFKEGENILNNLNERNKRNLKDLKTIQKFSLEINQKISNSFQKKTDLNILKEKLNLLNDFEKNYSDLKKELQIFTKKENYSEIDFSFLKKNLNFLLTFKNSYNNLIYKTEISEIENLLKIFLEKIIKKIFILQIKENQKKNLSQIINISKKITKKNYLIENFKKITENFFSGYIKNFKKEMNERITNLVYYTKSFGLDYENSLRNYTFIFGSYWKDCIIILEKIIDLSKFFFFENEKKNWNDFFFGILNLWTDFSFFVFSEFSKFF